MFDEYKSDYIVKFKNYCVDKQRSNFCPMAKFYGETHNFVYYSRDDLVRFVADDLATIDGITEIYDES
jgi:hypothetical protein